MAIVTGEMAHPQTADMAPPKTTGHQIDDRHMPCVGQTEMQVTKEQILERLGWMRQFIDGKMPQELDVMQAQHLEFPLEQWGQALERDPELREIYRGLRRSMWRVAVHNEQRRYDNGQSSNVAYALETCRTLFGTDEELELLQTRLDEQNIVRANAHARRLLEKIRMIQGSSSLEMQTTLGAITMLLALPYCTGEWRAALEIAAEKFRRALPSNQHSPDGQASACY